MADDCLAQLVVAALVALDDVHHELHHVLLDSRILTLHGIDLLHASLDHARNELARVSVDQNDPLVDQELLGLELYLNSLEHLNCLNNDLEGGFGHRCIILLEQKQVHFERPFNLSCELDSVGDLVCPDAQEILVIEHAVRVFETV